MIMPDLYFCVKPENYKNNKILIIPDDDILPLTDNINAFVLYQDSEKIIVKIRPTQENILSWADNSNGFDYLSLGSVEYIGISDVYIGWSWDTVVAAFPDLVEEIVGVDDNGEEYYYSKLQDVNIL